MFNYLNSLFIKKIFFLLFLNLTLSSIETKFTQYNNIFNNISEVCINDEDLAERNKKALEFIENCAVNKNYRKDNIVGISIHDNNTKRDIGYILCSSIINGKIYEKAIKDPEEIRRYSLLNPISMLDLLYMDVDSELGKKHPLIVKLNESRNNINRKSMETIINALIKIYIETPEDVSLDVSTITADYDLSSLQNLLKDFVRRLCNYSQEIPLLEGKNKYYEELPKLMKKLQKPEHLNNAIKYIYCVIGSPWSQYRVDDNCVRALELQTNLIPYFSVITHTEQMIDWLSRKFGYDIQVIISGKAPCLKCSNYISYGYYENYYKKTHEKIVNTWNNRTIIGFHTGWNDTKQLKEYQYPVKVFNATPVNTSEDDWAYTGTVMNKSIYLRQFNDPDDYLGTYSPSDSTLEARWKNNKDGLNGSNVYAIENYESYSKQLMMNSDGSVSEKEPKGVIPRNPLGRVNRTTYPILLPAEQNPTTGPDDQRDINTQQNPATDPIKRKREILLTPAQVTKRLRQEKRAKEKEETNKQSQYTSLKKNPSEERNKSNNPDDQQIPPPSLLNNF